jgi:hypothetical protein
MIKPSNRKDNASEGSSRKGNAFERSNRKDNASANASAKRAILVLATAHASP